MKVAKIVCLILIAALLMGNSCGGAGNPVIGKIVDKRSTRRWVHSPGMPQTVGRWDTDYYVIVSNDSGDHTVGVIASVYNNIPIGLTCKVIRDRFDCSN
jgi:hypothetical protein